jgi:hypothetical protein
MTERPEPVEKPRMPEKQSTTARRSNTQAAWRRRNVQNSPRRNCVPRSRVR